MVQNTHKGEKESSIESKHPSAWLKSLASPQTWTHREVEWQYYGQWRLLFACQSLRECEIWVQTIRNALDA